MMAAASHQCRWAALSLSQVAGRFIPELLHHPEDSSGITHELVAISTTGGPERATSWLREHNVSRPARVGIFPSWEKLLESGDFDVVYISSPTELHYSHIKKALECQRNVLVERPATVHQSQYQELLDLARKQNVVLMEATWTRYLPVVEHLQTKLLKEVGEIRHILIDIGVCMVPPDPAARSDSIEEKTQSTVDHLVTAFHWVNIIFDVSKLRHVKVTQVSRRAASTNRDPTGELITIRLTRSFDHEPEMTATITASMVPRKSSRSPDVQPKTKEQRPYIRIEATKASIDVSLSEPGPQDLQSHFYDESRVAEDPDEENEVISKPIAKGHGMWYEANEIAEKVAERAGQKSTQGEAIGADETLRVLQWIEQARELAGKPSKRDDEANPTQDDEKS